MNGQLQATFLQLWRDCWFFRWNLVFSIVGLVRFFLF